MVGPRWALFISGQGSNMSYVLDQKWQRGSVALVVSSNSESYGVLRARRKGIATLIFDKKINWSIVFAELQKQKITHIFLLGFMKVIPQAFLENWKKPILNIHPSLLPQYPGLDSVQRAFDDKKDVGASVHHVVAAVDAGALVMQKTAVSQKELRDKNLQDIQSQVHFVEYEIVWKSLRMASCWT